MNILRIISLQLFAIMLLAHGSALAQHTSGTPAMKIRGRGLTLVVTAGGTPHVLKVSKHIDAAVLDDVHLLFSTRRSDLTYLLVSACGSSTARSGAGHCGAGIECDLLWIAVDARWNISDIKSIHYESCWLPITSENGYVIAGDTLNMDYTDFDRKVDVHVSYNAAQPESGIAVEEIPSKDDGQN